MKVSSIMNMSDIMRAPLSQLLSRPISSRLHLSLNLPLVLCLSLLLALYSCQTQEQKQIRAFEQGVEQIRQKLNNVGLAVVLVKNNHIVYSQVFGYKSIDGQGYTDQPSTEPIPLKKDDLFRIASISKSFTTVGLLQQVELGRLSLTDDVSDLIGFRIRNPFFPDTVITLEMLLSHTSSLSDKEGYFNLNVINPETNPNADSCFNRYAPGCGYEYCNLNLNLSGAILERVSGERFDDYIHNHILQPLGLYGGYNIDSLDLSRLVNLYYVMPGGEKEWAQDAYVSPAKRLVNYRMGYDTPVFSPTGGMKLSAESLARWMTVHMNYGTTPDGIRLISEEHARDMQQPRSDDEHYGLTLWLSDLYSPGTTLVGHTGGAYGMRSAMFFNPEKKYGFVVISNGALETPEEEAVMTDPSGSTSEIETILTSTLRLMYLTFINDNKQ